MTADHVLRFRNLARRDAPYTRRRNATKTELRMTLSIHGASASSGLCLEPGLQACIENCLPGLPVEEEEKQHNPEARLLFTMNLSLAVQKP